MLNKSIPRVHIIILYIILIFAVIGIYYVCKGQDLNPDYMPVCLLGTYVLVEGMLNLFHNELHIRNILK